MDSFVGVPTIDAIFATVGGFVLKNNQVDRQKSSVLSWSSEVDLCKLLRSNCVERTHLCAFFLCVSETFMRH